MSVDREAQDDELLALASIYDEDEFHRAESVQGGEIRLCLELPPDFKLVVKGVGRTRHIFTYNKSMTQCGYISFYVLQEGTKLTTVSPSYHRWCSTLSFLLTIPPHPHPSLT